MQGKIVKGIAGFYYVHVVESGVYECKAKGIFRKDGVKPLVGDNVEIEVLDEEEKKGNIREILTRKNELIRPAVANIDQALVVFAVTKPKPHFNLLDRFLVMMEQKKIPVILCFNKSDIAKESDISKMEEIYRSCGYPVFFTSAKEGWKIEEVKKILHGKTTVLAGPSGVGKSSLINLLQSEVMMETGSISRKIDRGKHTTRHSELLVLEEDENEEAILKENSDHKPGALFQKLQKSNAEIIYKEEGVQTQSGLFLHYIDGKLQSLQGTIQNKNLDCVINP